MNTKLFDLNAMDRPKFVTWDTVNYVTVMGSHAYGTATPTSDYDFYGFLTPPAEVLFPHLRGEVPNFGRHKTDFLQYQVQHVPDPNYGEVDVTLYSLPRYFQLCMEGNPNMVDSLFTPESCVVWETPVGRLVRNKRHMFLSQKCYHTFKGMAYAHMSRLTNRTREGKRAQLVEKYGYDVKDASNMVRCLLEVKQLLLEGTMDLTANSKMLLEIKNGLCTKDEVVYFFENRLKELEDLEGSWVLPHSPDEDALRSLLYACLEMSYGNLANYGLITHYKKGEGNV